MTELSLLAVQNAGLLKALNAHKQPETVAALAREIGRDTENVRKSLAKTAEAGLTLNLALTEAGLEQVRAIGRAENGRDDMLPKGVALLTVGDIRPDPNQPRQIHDPDGDEELADSIALRDLLQPPTVWPAGEDGVHTIRFGERRWRALNILVRRGQWDPARKMLCRVRDSDDIEALEEALIENEQRAELHPLDLAEGLLKLADADRTAGQIEKVIGGRRKKRSIQQYVKVARELPGADKARMRLPESDPDHLSINAAIRLVTETKAKPALELTPRQAVTLVEIAHAAHLVPEVVNGEPGYARLWTVPTGGPIIQLSDKGLVNLRFRNGAVYAKALIHSSPAGEYLKELGFDDNKDICGWKAKVAALTEIGAKAIPPDAERRLWATPELRMPERTPETLAPTPLPDEPRTAFAPEPAIGPAIGPAAQAEPSSLDVAPPLSPAEQLVLLELAHRIFHEGIDLPGGMRAARVCADYYRDPRVGDLTTGKSMLVFSTRGQDGPIAGLTGKAAAWLNGQGFAKGEQGWLIRDHDIADVFAETEIAIERPDDWDGYFYATPWLNLEPPPALDEGPAPPAPTFQSPLYQQIKDIRADAGGLPIQPSPKLPALEDALRVIRWLDGALAAAADQLDRATVRKPAHADLAQVRALIENARGAAVPMLAIDPATIAKAADRGPVTQPIAHAVNAAAGLATPPDEYAADSDAAEDDPETPAFLRRLAGA